MTRMLSGRWRVFSATLLLVVVGAFACWTWITSASDQGPQLITPPGSEEVFEYYEMELLQDGYPGRKPKGDPWGEVRPHPLYGVYLIRASLREWHRSGDQAYLDQAVQAGKAAISRMEPRGAALIFEYEAESPFNFREEAY